MKRYALALALIATSAGANATSATTPKKGNDCIFMSTIGQYRALDRNNVVIWAPGRRNAYLVELSMPLFGLNSTFQLAMIDKDNDGRLCSGFDRLGVRDHGRPETSSINGVTKLDDAGIAQLEEKYQVQLTSKKGTQKGEKAEEDT